MNGDCPGFRIEDPDGCVGTGGCPPAPAPSPAPVPAAASETSPVPTLLFGTQTPTVGQGIDGDLYLETPSGQLYVKQNGAWVRDAGTYSLETLDVSRMTR